jgi:glycosyltransferase involved in cell wall biosynthesis
MHDSNFRAYYDKAPRPLRAVIRATMRRADAFVALGDVWATRIREIAPDVRITAIPNAVRVGSPVLQDFDPVHVVFLGRIGDHKGTFRLLDAWAKLVCEPGFDVAGRSAAVLTIAGDGEGERARRCIDDLSLQDSVAVHDWLSEARVDELLDSAQVLVLPSRNEGQPMAVLEAMARGLCVIATDVGGIPEMIGGGCGVLIPPDDTEAIAAALREVVGDCELRARYGAAAHDRAGTCFGTDTVARRIDALYREVCA